MKKNTGIFLLPGPVTVLILLPLLFLQDCAGPEEQQRPNIVYVIVDQMASDAMSCAGNPLVSTPSLDRLAGDGVRFDRAYCAFPLCVPSRAAMFTGRMPHEAGIYVNTNIIRDEELPFETLAWKLNDGGYQTHYIGKWHLTIPMDDSARHGFQQVEHPGVHGFDSVNARLAVEFLRQKHVKPFFLCVSFMNPHDCCWLVLGQDLSELEGPIPALPATDKLPPLPDNFGIPEGEPDYIRRWQEENSERIYPSFYWDETQFRAYQWQYYRLVEKVDSLLGRVFDAVYASPDAGNTIIIFSSDHGDGSSRHHWNQKWSAYDESAKVPFIIAGKPVRKKGTSDSRLVSSGLDLLPTVCDYAGVNPPEKISGRSLRPLLDDRPEGAWRKYVVTEISFGSWVDSYHTDTFPRARMLRTEDYKYVVFDHGMIREQLIDMQNDPGEMKNLAMDPAYGAVLDEHRKYLKEWIELTGDSFRPDTDGQPQLKSGNID